MLIHMISQLPRVASDNSQLTRIYYYVSHKPNIAKNRYDDDQHIVQIFKIYLIT